MKIVEVEASVLDRQPSGAEHEVHEAYRPRGKRSKVVRPRAVRHGYLREARDRTTGILSPGAIRRAQVVDRQLDALAEAAPVIFRPAAEIYQAVVAATPVNAGPGAQENGLTPAKRQQYAALETRKEIVATLLAAGSTEVEAADHAGISTSTVSKYLEDPEFRARIRERTSLALGVVQGRIVGWMDRRTADATTLDHTDPKIVLAIYDRVAGRPGALHAEQTNVTVNNYTDLMGRLAESGRRAQAAVRVDDAAEEGFSFPVVGSDSPPVAGGGS